jgi:hypothetical protein
VSSRDDLGWVKTEISFGKSEIRLDTPADKPPDGQITIRQRESRSCPGRGAALFALLRRAGTYVDTRTLDPGSAAHHAASAARCAASGERVARVERVDKLSPEKPITAAKCNRWVSRSLSSGAHSRDPLAPPTLLADPDHRRIPQYLSNGSALPLPLWERVGVRSCSVPANHNLSPGLHRYPAIPLALALWLLNSLPGLGDIKHANSGNRGARRHVGRLRVECSGHCAGIYFTGDVSAIYLRPASPRSSGRVSTSGGIIGRSRSKTHERRSGDCGSGRHFLACGVLCRRGQADSGGTCSNEGPDGRDRAGINSKEMRNPVPRQAAGSVIC